MNRPVRHYDLTDKAKREVYGRFGTLELAQAAHRRTVRTFDTLATFTACHLTRYECERAEQRRITPATPSH